MNTSHEQHDDAHGCYEVKLSRLGNLFCAPVAIFSSILLACVAAHAAANAFSDKLDVADSIVFAVIAAVLFALVIFYFPRCMDVTPSTVTVQYHGALLYLFIRSKRKSRSTTWEASDYSKAYTLYRIDGVSYRQSRLEKLFHLGHVTVRGLCNSDEHAFAEKKTFTVYGVKDFENTAEWMKDFLQVSQ